VADLPSEGLGSLRPRALETLERAALAWAGGSLQRLEDAFDEVFGVLPCGDGVLSSGVPPEVLPLVSFGREGPHFGYVLRAPELEFDDAPVVSFGADRSVRPFARTTADAFVRLAALRAEEDDELDPRLAEALCAALELPARAAPRPTDLRPEVPVGYQWRPGRDGIGVLARKVDFGSEPIPSLEGLSLGEIDAWTSRLLHAGLPAAACALLRDAFALGHGRPATWDRLAPSWVASYRALERPGLAEQVKRRTARFG